MEATTLPWLNAVVGTIASTAVGLLIVVNGLFALGLLLRRDRHFVNRWTKPLVVADAALVIAAIGTPVVGLALTLGAKGVAFVATATAKLLPGK
jgi:hypothetical protein